MSRQLSSKEKEILKRQRVISHQRSSNTSSNRNRPPPPAVPPPITQPRSSKPTSSLRSLLSKKDPSFKPPKQQTTSSNRLQKHVPRKSDPIDLTADSPPTKQMQQLPVAKPVAVAVAVAVKQPLVPMPTFKRAKPKTKRNVFHNTNPHDIHAVISATRSRIKSDPNSNSDSISSDAVTTTTAAESAAVSVAVKGTKGTKRASKKPPPHKQSSTTSSSSASSGSKSSTTTGPSSGRLSSLLHQAGITKQSLKLTTASNRQCFGDEEDRLGSALDMDDYYRNLREWDFLLEWDSERGGGSGKSGGNGNGGSDKKRKKGSREEIIQSQAQVQEVPNVFASRRQYQKIWAPLCLAETRAQFLSDASGDLPWIKPSHNGNNHNNNGGGDGGNYNNRRNKGNMGPVPVLVKPSVKDVGANVDAMTLVTSPWQDNMGPSFFSGDLVCFAMEESVFVKASKGQLMKGARSNSHGSSGNSSIGGDHDYEGTKAVHGVIGHVEYSRRTTDGLKVRISRQNWVKFCKGEKVEKLFLLKVGGNVTSMREFTALLRVNTSAMLPYLLCKKITKAKDHMEQLSDVISSVAVPMKSSSRSSSSQQKARKDDFFKKLGGKAALGEGFAKYAGNKFNDSQLGAISAAACEYGEGGFTLVKGPPGTGKTTTLICLLNALHIRQFNQYYQSVKDIVDVKNTQSTGATKEALTNAAKMKPRLLVCAPSNNAIDNVIQKIMEGGFIDGAGGRYNPSIVRVGIGQSDGVKDVSLASKVNELMAEMEDPGKIQDAVAGCKSELSRLQIEIHSFRCRLMAMLRACDYPLPTEWEIRCDDALKITFVNHLERRTTYECPPPPEPGESFRSVKSQPEYKLYQSRLVKLVDRFASISSKLERYGLLNKSNDSLRLMIETHILDTTHIVLTTLGTAGCLALESSAKFEVVVVDEAAQSVEPATLVALQLGSTHAILVGDPQQLPATIFSVSGRTTKYDRSLFQRLEEAGHEVHLLDTQYRMHPQISKFSRNIFYGGYLKDGENVRHPSYGNPLLERVRIKLPSFHPFTVFDLDSSEERGGSSLSNSMEARFAVQLYQNLTREFGIFVSTTKVSVITPYAQQAALLRRTFSQALGYEYHQSVEVNTVDSFQGREANIVIFSCVRAAGSKGIGFLSDVRRMNVALTRAKHFLFVIARCDSICVNPYWDQIVKDARNNQAVVSVPRSFVDSAGTLSQLKTDFSEEYLKRRRLKDEPKTVKV